MAVVVTCWGILSLIFAFFIPPIGVLMHNGCGKDLIINILLTILGYIPGIIHAVYIICTTPASCFGEGPAV